ncbi:MAG: peptide-methionine (R)-S-oxide reductase MsrB [Acidobacteria bacterium]|nr:peptide-methionine (R)-S-oxide reductase MsrB [Acidobacteriota bacterium]
MDRRQIFALLTSTAFAAKGPRKVRIAEFDPSGKKTQALEVDRVEKTEAEWRAQLTPEQFYVTRKEGTERAFTGKYHDHHGDGLYKCVGCSTVLFDSRTKFESGTGWPSFYQPAAKENVREVTDNSHGMQRVEVECARCGGHLGHVFPDGPRPTGLRYCMNSASMTFSARGK